MKWMDGWTDWGQSRSTIERSKERYVKSNVSDPPCSTCEGCEGVDGTETRAELHEQHTCKGIQCLQVLGNVVQCLTDEVTHRPLGAVGKLKWIQ